MAGLVTIGELVLAVQQALEETAYPGQKSGRIREVPDRRTIRYYTTIGLLDKPAEMRGRTAYYGRRHLLQLVAIKRLQAQGKSLVEIQAALAGASDSALLKWSDSRDSFLETFQRQIGKSKEEAPTRRAAAAVDSKSITEGHEEFWAAEPQTRTPAVGTGSRAAAAATTAVHLKVTDNVTLVIEGAEAIAFDLESLSKLQPALDSLRNTLKQNGGLVEQNPRIETDRSEDPE